MHDFIHFCFQSQINTTKNEEEKAAIILLYLKHAFTTTK